VVVWGGPARLRFHGVAPLYADEHPLLGARRINLTFRKAGGRRSAKPADELSPRRQARQDFL
jgi:hypothetical protein